MFTFLLPGWRLPAAAVVGMVATAATVGAAAAPVPPSDPATLEAYRRLPYCKLAPDGKRLAEEPCRRPPTRGFAERRAVPALPPQPSPPQAREPGPEWHPTLIPRTAPAAPAARAPSPPPATSMAPVPPVQPLNQCGIAGCRGANGALYQPGAGDILLDPSGRLCTRHGQWVHCQ